jgi:hypothetical protein
MRLLLVLFGLLPGLLLAADRWHFDGRIAVAGPSVAGVFHHLEGAGRKHIAVSAGRVGVVWEDNSSGDSQVYLATREPGSDVFSTPQRVSSADEAYEPAIVALKDGAFALAWEQGGAIYLQVERRASAPVVVRLVDAGAGQVSLASAGSRLLAVWRERDVSGWWLRVAELEYQASGLLRLNSVRSVEPDATSTPVLFPTIVATRHSTFVAWEDRRAGHTRLMSSVASSPDAAFDEPQYLNEFSSNRNPYDKGNGVTRVSATLVGEQEVLAAWMDKRRSNVGYGIFAAMGGAVGTSFGPNEKVHSARGDLEPHYNPAVAGNARGDFVVVWDDFRNGDNDIWLSTYTDDLEWSEDFAPGVASGGGEQSHPSVVLDAQGHLHLIWLERANPDAPSRLWYAVGRLKGDAR